jgi:hypothetical protein
MAPGVRKYIDINSSYRNRLSYPFVGDFVIPTNGLSSRNTAQSAYDPVILAFPYEASLCSGLSTTTQIALNVLASTISNFYPCKCIKANIFIIIYFSLIITSFTKNS